jgi:hypothetical protein
VWGAPSRGGAPLQTVQICEVGPPSPHWGEGKHGGMGAAHMNAWMPVCARPRISAWMSWVPS